MNISIWRNRGNPLYGDIKENGIIDIKTKHKEGRRKRPPMWTIYAQGKCNTNASE